MGLPQKIEFVISCQPRNISKLAFGIGAPLPSPAPARPGRPRAEESLLILRRLCGNAVFVLYYQKIFLAAIDGD
jgi:hypothetical protein